ncbi:MAG: tryptophan--tRNA ligase [Thiotrichales bacterium]|jgi:tryptophanyl-tRNA synthetase|nr:tryptophan--tRNA ligase [Thiotrichales bacterium]MBT3613981.1 tryptophan--tRNA ligase [Thiotrichales bacterium]MBT3752098.1 tryptophan--tRNA ligase [Thiotrichales bacterium]MBT3836812.1 tryptophan--tRNA ligase [Thiotrichales bacterium]MBT4151586.1 tryptophan--tRNA ligase [Thiotrichales bacterium]
MAINSRATIPSQFQRVVSGMRPTGNLHLGHYHGVLKNWVRLQNDKECFFFVADWHALTTHYEDSRVIEESVWDMVIDWLAAGVNPKKSHIFIQSQVPEHAELHTLLSMMTPLSWLERVPTYKDQQEKLKERDLSTYGFLGYPLLQSADILAYRAGEVPVGEDQVAHVELTREVARRFNHIYGKESGFEQKAEIAAKKMGKKNAKIYARLRRSFQEEGNHDALETARALLEDQQNITMGDRERLFGYLDGGGKVILPEPQPLLTKASKMPGIDGQKMSKSYGNTISLREDPEEVKRKIRTMPTDPARVRLTDPGDPAKCPVWDFHKIYTDESVRGELAQGCKNASIGCVDCKQYVVEGVLKELLPMQERARNFTKDPKMIRTIIEEGGEFAREEARRTMVEVRHAMGLSYSK